jgi:mycofactocin glycosyltransferase
VFDELRNGKKNGRGWSRVMNASPAGTFSLKPGIELMSATMGGVVLQTHPLRALKVNPPAFKVLMQCKTGFELQQSTSGNDAADLTFLDALQQNGLISWEPASIQEMPFVSIVIPVYNRENDIRSCLESLCRLDYPSERMEVIVVDDASTDRTAQAARSFGVNVEAQPRNLGQSVARNLGISMAKGEIIAFLDSDCRADPAWLKELIPYFQDPRISLVGGLVDAPDRKTCLDRYEAACSALNMGRHEVIGRGKDNVFYVPTCNMLVRKSVVLSIGGLDETLRVGEDVDFCWRLLAAGHHLAYIPKGRVLHRHPTRLWATLRRRFDYGTSEAVLYHRFPGVFKKFPFQPTGLVTVFAIALGLAASSLGLLVAAAAFPLAEACFRKFQLKDKMGVSLSFFQIVSAVVKSHFRLAYFLSFYLVRYYLVLLILFLGLPMPAWILSAVIFLPLIVAYAEKKPDLSFPVFAFLYGLEQIFYQSGAFCGCIKEHDFRLYGIRFVRARFLKTPNRENGKRRFLNVNQ